MADLTECREKLDLIDRQIVSLFEERMRVVADVAEYKLSTGKEILDRGREEDKLSAVAAMAEGDFQKTAVRELFSQIMAISRKYQYGLLSRDVTESGTAWRQDCGRDENVRVAFFGVKGTYTEQAMEEFFGTQVQSYPEPAFRDVMQAVKDGRADYGVLPIENSSTGGITDIYDLLLEYDNRIVGEHVVKIDHVLLGTPDSEFSDIRKVYSHSQPLMQCREYLESNPQIELQEFGSTAGCACKVKEDGDRTQAAIASRRAGLYYGLKVLAEDISIDEGNSTRFIILSSKPVYQPSANKISICFEAPHVSGALHNLLSHFLYNHLNMTNIESRPMIGKKWEYRFFVDFEGNLLDPAVRNALTGIKAEAASMIILGNYKSPQSAGTTV